MKKNGKRLTKTLFLIVSLISLFCTVTSCNSWMADDGFYEDIESEVKYANAAEINVFVRYASTEMGNTSPEGYVKFKQDIEAEISATTTDNYGFYKWAAFSTSFLQTDVQNSDFVFESDEDYAAKYAPNELPDSVVYFADRKSPKTTIKVLEQRPDIFIIPVVVVRPSVSLTIPGNGANSVIRNMTIRINFSKPMDRDSFFNEQGICDKITITQGTQSFNADGTIEVTSEDITEKFDTDSIKIKPEEGQGAISTNGKMLTLKFKPNGENEAPNGFTAQSYVNIKISDDIKDIYGYTMGSPGKDKTYTLSFQAGAYFDTLAPRISELSAGIGSEFIGFVGLYENPGTVQTLGSFTTFPTFLNSNNVAIGAPEVLPNFLEDVTEDYYKAELLNQRVQNSVNIRILAEDISGSGSGQSQMGVESDVRQIFVKANRVVDLNGEPVPNDEANRIIQKTISYSAQGIESQVFAGKKYTDLIDSANGKYAMSLNKSKGFIFDYDLSSLADGLIRIDIAAADSVGNSGFGSGGQYSSEYGNGYATIFVVKDTTAPDAESFASTISSKSTKAVYGWYNEESYDDIKIIGSSIVDIGHPKLRANYDKLKWIFTVNGDASWKPSIGEFSSFIKDGYQINISPESKPQEDGPFVLTYAIMDDLGNISNTARVDSIIYDNTKPVINNEVLWVDASGKQVRNTTKELSTGNDVYLRIPFVEKTSGIRRITASVKELTIDSVEESKFFYSQTSDSTGEEINLISDPSVSDIHTKVFEKEYKTDDRTQDYLYINNIKIGDTDGLYHVDVAVTDQALNVSDVYEMTFSRDTTTPTISNLVVYDNSDTSENHDSIKTNSNGNWLKGNTEKAISFTIKDEGSGIETINIGGAELTSSSELYLDNTVVNKTDADGNAIYTVNGNTITFIDYTNPIIQGTTTFTVKITNVNLLSSEAAEDSHVKITVTDFANSGNSDATYYIKWDFTPTDIASSISIYNETTLSTQYTKTRNVKMKLIVPADASGIVKLILKNAVFTSTNSDTINLTNPNTTNETLFDIRLTQDGDGFKSVTVTTEDIVGNVGNEKVSGEIICDETLPVIGNLQWLVPAGSIDVPGAVNTNIISQTLLIPITEPTAGIKKLTVDVKKDGNSAVYTNPYGSGSLEITDSNDNPITSYTVSSNTIIFTTPITSVNTTSIKIKNLQIADSNVEGSYKVYIKVEDAAENKDTTTASDGSTTSVISISNDITRPQIKTINIPGLQKVVSYNTGDVKYYLSASERTNNGNSFETNVILKVIEIASGVRKIEISDTSLSNYTDDIVLYYDNVEFSRTKYTIDNTQTGKLIINIPDPNDSLRNLTGNEFEIKLSGLRFEDYEHSISVKLSDVANNESSNTSSPVSESTIISGTLTGITTFYTDYSSIALTKTNGQTNFLIDNNDNPYKAEAGYTNNENIDYQAFLTMENINSSGINKIVVSGASLSSAAIYYKTNSNPSSNLISSDNYVITDGTVLTFKDDKAITKDGSLMIKGLILNPTDGNKQVTITYYDVSNISPVTSFTTESIILDKTPPAWTSEGAYAYYNASYIDTTYPKASQTENVYGHKIENAIYFYTKNDENHKGYYVGGSATDAGGLRDNYIYYTTSSSYYELKNNNKCFDVGSYKMIAVDKAGNQSSVVTFKVVKDEAIPSYNLSGYITLEKPSDEALIYRTTENSLNKYVVRPTATPFKIVINLSGTTSAQTLLEGTNAATKLAIAEVNGTTTASPLYEYAVYTTGTPSYNKYVKNSGEVTKNGFTTSVDSNGNIVINVPSSKTESEIKLKLKDGCGNEHELPVSNTETGVMWDVDDRLGGTKVITEGVNAGSTGTRSIGMNPISSQSTSGDNTEKWGNVTYSWGHQASTTSWITPYDGDSITGRAVKNKVNNTTYYTNDVKMGLFISSDPDHNNSNDDYESITYAVTGKRSDPATPEQVAAGEYTARAKLYCTKNPPTNAPNYSTIVNTSESNGQVTPWCYVRTKAEVDTIFFMDYPHPNYTALNWSPKEPYYIYYLVEDRVGNYEIETIVNSHSDTEMVKWLYDAEGPKVTLRGKTTSPADVTTNVSDLVPNNNGYKASYNASKYYTWWSTNPTGTYNDAQGKGTTRTVGGAPERKNAPFFDIDVTDDSGIRAFAYSDTYIENPEVSTFSFYTAEQGEKTWFGGQGSPTKDTIIGESWTDSTYNDAGKYKVLKADGSVDNSYSNVYTGAAVCSVLPLYEATLTGNVLYLYVMDWVGNVSCTKMGNFTWNKDTDKPEAGSGTTEKLGANYIASKTDGIIISEKDSSASVKLEIPTDWYSEGTTSIYGYSFTQNDVSTVSRDGTTPYLEIPYSTFSKWPASGTNQIEFWVYDCVGNCNPSRLNALYDITAPTLEVTISAGDGKLLYQPDWDSTNTDSQSGNAVNLSSYHDYFIYCSNPANDNPNNKLFITESEIAAHATTVFTNNASVTVQLGTLDADGKQRLIKSWNGSEWVSGNTLPAWLDGSNGDINRTGKWNGESFTWDGYQTSKKATISLSTTPTYYCFSLVDKSGNTSYAYFKLAKDTTGPVISNLSFEKVNTVNSINYYSDSSKISYTVQDNSGVQNDGFTTYTEYKNSVNVNVALSSVTLEVNKLKITTKDNINNSTETQLYNNNVSNWSYDNSTPSCGSISSAKQYIANNYYSQANNDILGVDVTRKQGEGYSSITISPTNTSHVSTISATGVSSFKINNVSNFVGSTTAKGWKVIESSSGVPTKPDFVSWDGIDVGKTDNSYTFNSSNWTDKSYYFYPVNYAGTVGNPIVFTFETPIKPTVTKESVTGDYNNTSQIYFKDSCNASLIIKNPSTSKAISVTGYFLYAKDSGDYSYITEETFAEPISINPNNSSNYNLIISNIGDNNGKKIYVQIKTNYTVSDYVSIGYLVKDTTAPTNIKIDSVKSNDLSSGFGYKVSDTKVMYGNNTTKVELILTATENVSGIAGYSLDQVNWSNTITINKATSFNSLYTVYAKDNVGNIASQDFTFASDSIAPSITNFSCTAANTYIDSTNKKIYFNSASLPVTVTSTDTDVGYYKYNSNTSETGEFSLSDAGDYVFYAVDKVGNESSPYTIKLIKDSVPPATPSGTLTFYNGETQVTTGYIFDNVNNTVRFNPNKVTKVVFTPDTQTDDATTSGDGAGSGIKGYSDSRTATTWGSTVTFELSSSDSNTSKKVYVKDNVGNVCTSSLSYSFTADSTGPAPASGVTINENPDYSTFKAGDMSQTIKAINLPSNAFTVTTAQDDIVGGGFTTVMLNSGTKFTLALADSDCVGYGFTYGVNASALVAPTFTSVTPNDANKIEVTLPNNVVGPHYFIFLWLKDSLGNISTYNVMHDSHGWFLSKPTASVSVTYSVVDENLIIEGLQQVPITSVQISGSNLNGCSDTINFDYNIETNYVDTKSYNKQYSKSGSDSSVTLSISNPWITGSGKITINVGNDATVSDIIINGDTTNIICSSAPSPIRKFTSTIAKGVRSVFTPKTKKIYLSSEVETKTIEKDTGVISQNNQPSLTKTASPKKNNKPKVRKANNSNKVLDSSVVKNTVIQKKNNVIPEDAKVLESTPIDVMSNTQVIASESVENSGVETTVVKNDTAVSNQNDNMVLIYSIIAIVMCAVIAMVVIVNKLIVDKTK